VLQKRWVVECNHGCLAEVPETNSELRWHEVGQIDPVKAILIMNE